MSFVPRPHAPTHHLAARLALECCNRIFHCIWRHFPSLWPMVDTLLLVAVAIVRIGSGMKVAKGLDKCERPQQPLVLYESSSDPDSRLVRETLSVLDLDYVSYPCPKESMAYDSSQCLNSHFRPQLAATGGMNKLPLLVDPDKNVKLYFADHINKYLWSTYGKRATAPVNYKIAQHPAFRSISLFVCQLLRPCMFMGLLRAARKKIDKPLELWGYAESPFVNRVMEVLCRLEIPYVMRSVAKGSGKRTEFRTKELDRIPSFSSQAKPGVVQVPMLRDPNNNDLRLLESQDIVEYLTTTYQTHQVNPDSWLYSTGQGPEFSHSSAAVAVMLVCIGPPLLALSYACAAILRMI